MGKTGKPPFSASLAAWRDNLFPTSVWSMKSICQTSEGKNPTDMMSSGEGWSNQNIKKKMCESILSLSIN